MSHAQEIQDDDDDLILHNPMMNFLIFGDGSVDIEYIGETGGRVRHTFDRPELMMGQAVSMRELATDSKKIQIGKATFSDIAHRYGGIGDDSDFPSNEELIYDPEIFETEDDG